MQSLERLAKLSNMQCSPILRAGNKPGVIEACIVANAAEMSEIRLHADA
jgi:hypothetical protein